MNLVEKYLRAHAQFREARNGKSNAVQTRGWANLRHMLQSSERLNVLEKEPLGRKQSRTRKPSTAADHKLPDRQLQMSNSDQTGPAQTSLQEWQRSLRQGPKHSFDS